jgi:hypothetical protein
MKILDFKSFIIGFLCSVCVFLFMGQTNNKNLSLLTADSLYVKSITLLSAYDGTIYKTTIDPFGINVYNSDPEFGEVEIDMGATSITGKNNNTISFDLSIDDIGYSYLDLYSNKGTNIISLQPTKEGNGSISLYDKLGNNGWFQTSKK